MTIADFLAEWHQDSPTVLVHTSGSTGQPKPLWVEKRRMEASARITCDFLGLKEGDTALLCMSLDYIAGKMMVVRSLLRGLRLIVVEPDGHPLRNVTQSIDFAAMVPMQVYNSLQVPEERERLRQIRQLIIGGGAVDDALAAELIDFPHAVWSTYGMTETLSHIALRRLNGDGASDWYEPFPSVSVSQDNDGCLIIDAPMVCPERLVTHDLVEISPQGSFRILGRKDNVICSGGVKIQIEEVERLLRPHLPVPFLISKRRDIRFGEAVVLLYERGCMEADSCPFTAGEQEYNLRQICESVLPRYWRPRDYVAVGQLPLTTTGKPARAEAERIVANSLREGSQAPL